MKMTIVNKLLDGLIMVILGMMSVLVALNVFFRFVLNFSLYWGDELAQILLVWLTFLGAAVATREKSHYVFTYFLDKMAGKWHKIFTLVRDCLNILIISILLYYSSKVSFNIQSWIMPALEFSRSFVYGAAPVGCIFMLIYSFKNLVIDLKENT